MNGPAKRLRGAELEARDAQWIRLAGLGIAPAEIADRFGVSRSLVNRRLRLVKRAREMERGPAIGDAESAVDDPKGARAPEEKKNEGPPIPWWLELVPLFPIGPLTPRSECGHKGLIRPGSLFCCMVCSKSGMDGHPALERNPKLDPAPEPPPKSPAPAAVGGKPKGQETRRENRARKFGRVA